MNNVFDFLEITRNRGFVFGLDKVKNMLKHLGNPDHDLKFIHVAGTNGKGSTSTFIASVLKAAGYCVGFFSSPALNSPLDEIAVDGISISLEDFSCIVDKIKKVSDDNEIPVTEFEVMTVAAILYFMERGVDFVVFEVGLGGRFDATNAIENKIVAVITHIGLDHVGYLGNSLEEIAYEKAGIITSATDVVVYDQASDVIEVIKKRAAHMKSDVIVSDFSLLSDCYSGLGNNYFSYKRFKNIKTRLFGKYQFFNAALALDVVELLISKGVDISDDAVYRGMYEAHIPGRMQLLCDEPIVIVDGGHNPQGVRALRDSLCEIFPNRKFAFIMGSYKDKDYAESLRIIDDLAESYYTVTAPGIRGLSGDLLKLECEKYAMSESFDSVGNAIEYAFKNNKDSIIVIFGTLSIVSDAIAAFKYNN